MAGFCQLWLTCADTVEADTIAKTLLDKRLIACSRYIAASSDYRWQGKIDHSSEVLLMMESHLDLFEKIEAEVSKLHSYDTFVLEAVEVKRLSTKASKWLKEELK